MREIDDERRHQAMQRKVEFIRLSKILRLPRKMIAEIVSATEPQIQGWLDGLEGAEHYLATKEWPGANVNQPQESAVDALREFTIAVAHKAIHDGRSIEGENPFSKQEFIDANRQNVKGVISMISDSDEGRIHRFDILGRVGFIGSVSSSIDRKLGSVEGGHYIPDFEATVAFVDDILDNAWFSYRNWLKLAAGKKRTELEEFLWQKTRYRNFIDFFGLTAEAIALYAGIRTPQDVAAGNKIGLSEARSWAEYSRPVLPPLALVNEMQTAFLGWARDLFNIVEKERGNDARSVGLVLPSISASELDYRLKGLESRKIVKGGNLSPIASREMKILLRQSTDFHKSYSIFHIE